MTSVEQFIDEMWSGIPITHAGSAFRSYLAETRKHLGAKGVTRAGAFIQLAPTIPLDIDRFERCCAEAETTADSDPARAVSLLIAGLAYWRGEPYQGIDTVPGVVDTGWLLERRSTAEDHLVAAHLRNGDAALAVALLRRLVAEQPDREKRTELLMTALTDEGRVSEALRAYDHYRRHLATTSGGFPSPQLIKHERALLAMHPEPLSPEAIPGSAETTGSVLDRLRAAERDWSEAIMVREQAFDTAVSWGDHALAARIALHAEGSGRSFFGEERLGALLRRAILLLSPDGESQLLARLHAEYVCRIGLETGPSDDRVKASGAWLAAHQGDAVDPHVAMVTDRALLHLRSTISPGMEGCQALIESLLERSQQFGEIDSHADALAFAARAALASADGSAWRHIVDDVAQFAAFSTARPIDRWARHAIAATHADLCGDSSTWAAHLDAAQGITNDNDIADAVLARGAALLAMSWQDALDGSLMSQGGLLEVEGEGLGMFSAMLNRSFFGTMTPDDPFIAALIGHAVGVDNALLRSPLLTICAQIIWNVGNAELAAVVFNALESDDSAMVVVGMSPVACFGPTDRYRALLGALIGDPRVETFLTSAATAAERCRAPRWRARILHDVAAIRTSNGHDDTNRELMSRATVASGFATRTSGHRRSGQLPSGADVRIDR